MRRVIGIGETILDIIFNDNQPRKAVPGGSVFNAFVSLGRLGVPLEFISELGNDRVGGMIKRFMQENNIPTDYIDCFPDGRSPVSLAFLDKDLNAEYMFYNNYPGQRLNVALPKIDADDILILSSYYVLNPAIRERVLDIIRYASERKAIIYYDPNFRKAHANEAIFLMPTVLENFEFADIIRGSDEDFRNLFGSTDVDYVYRDHISFYSKLFLATHGREGVDLFTGKFKEHYDADVFTPVSTIGAGDNFNAGIIYGLLKYDIRRADLPDIGKATWDKIIRCGMDLAREACMSYDNYIPEAFASDYARQS